MIERKILVVILKDDYGDPERRPAWFAPAWLDDGLAPLVEMEKTLSEDYGLDFFDVHVYTNDLEILDVFKAKPLTLWECILKGKNIKKNTRLSSFYFIWSKFKRG